MQLASKCAGVLTPRFLRFCAVGGVGFMVDAAVLLLLIRMTRLDPLAGRLVSFSAAVFVTFELNRHWTFESSAGRPYGVQLARYLGVQSIGFACNLVVYAATYVLLRPWAAAPLVALGGASAAARMVNYLGTRAGVFSADGGRSRSPGWRSSSSQVVSGPQ